jgi:hypothetical protein
VVRSTALRILSPNCLPWVYLTSLLPPHLILQIHRVWEYLVSFIVPMDANRELVPTRYVLICSINVCFVVRGGGYIQYFQHQYILLQALLQLRS